MATRGRLPKLKDDESRVVPILKSLLPILSTWKLRFASCELSPNSTLTWYQATRHTFASHWVLSGGSLEKLANVMGHSSVVVTERYAHLRPDLFREEDYERLEVDLLKPVAKVLPMEKGVHVPT